MSIYFLLQKIYCIVIIYIASNLFHRKGNIVMSEISNDFTWVRQLGCPPTVFNDSMKKMFVYLSIYQFYFLTETLVILTFYFF